MARDLFEEEEGFSEELEDITGIAPADLNAVTVNGTDWTVGTIYTQIRKGNIALDPYFQRRDAWSAARKSQYIESLILGIPVPQIVLGEIPGSRGRFVVIDGKQRLLSIVQFYATTEKSEFNPLKLRDLPILSELNGQTMASLQKNPDRKDIVDAFENQDVRTNIVRNVKNDDILYQVFLRLNTGSVKLSPQELRRALTPSSFWTELDALSEQSLGLATIFRGKIPDFRMRDVELLLRFVAFRRFLPAYNGNLKAFLDGTARHYASDWPAHRADFLEAFSDFEHAVDTTLSIFGENAFQKYRLGRYEGRFNRAVFDIMLAYFSMPEVRNVARQSNEIPRAFEALCDGDDLFVASIERTTKSVEATRYRLAAWGNELSAALSLNIAIDLPG